MRISRESLVAMTNEVKTFILSNKNADGFCIPGILTAENHIKFIGKHADDNVEKAHDLEEACAIECVKLALKAVKSDPLAIAKIKQITEGLDLEKEFPSLW